MPGYNGTNTKPLYDKLLDVVDELSQLNQSLTAEDFATQTTLDEVLTAVTDVVSKLQIGIDNDAYDDVNDRIKVDLESSNLIGEVDANPTEYTIQDRLKKIYDSLEQFRTGHGYSQSTPTYVEVVDTPVTDIVVSSGVDGTYNVPSGYYVKVLMVASQFDADATLKIGNLDTIPIARGLNLSDDYSDAGPGPFDIIFGSTRSYYIRLISYTPQIVQPMIISPSDGDTGVPL